MIRPLALALILILILAASPAQAHRMKLFVSAEGAEMVARAYFVGGEPAQGIDIQVTAADGAPIALLKTDPAGQARLTAALRQDHLFLAESQDGHTAHLRLSADQLPPHLAAAPGPVSAAGPDLDRIEAALARQVRPLKEQIDQLESRARLSDLIGGVGMIFGLFGLWAWKQSRRETKS